MFTALCSGTFKIRSLVTSSNSRAISSSLLFRNNFSQATITCSKDASERHIASLLSASRRNFHLIEDRLIANYKNKCFDPNGEILSLFLIELLRDKGPIHAIDSIHRLLQQPIKVNLTQFAINAIFERAVEEKALTVEKLLAIVWKHDISFVPAYDAIVTNVLLPFLRWDSIDKIATKHTFTIDTYMDIFDTLLSLNSEQKGDDRPYQSIAKLLHRWKTIGVNVHQKNILGALEAIILHLADDLPDKDFLKLLANL